MRMNLEESAAITLELIREFIEREGFSPTYDEIADIRGCSKWTIGLHIQNLVERGLLTRAGNKQRTWRIAEGA